MSYKEIRYIKVALWRQWKVIDVLLFYVYSGIVPRFDGKVAVLESPWISKKLIYEKTGLCLSFSYLLSAYSESSISFVLLTSSNVSLWSLHGYQGQTWQTGQVTFKPREDFKVQCLSGSIIDQAFRSVVGLIYSIMPSILQVLIAAIGNQTSGINPVTIKNIRIATAQCKRLPLHSLPGTYSFLMVFTLSITEFLKTFWARSAVQRRKVCALIWTYEWLKYANNSGGFFTSRSFTDQLSLKLQFF